MIGSLSKLSKKIFVQKDFAIYLFCFIFGISIFFYIAPETLGTSPDSMLYLAVADNIAQGKGITVPIIPWDFLDGFPQLTETPPLFPLLIALIKIMQIDVFSTLLLINATLFAVGGVLVFYYTKEFVSSIKFSSLAYIMYITSIPLIFVHLHIWTEPMFIFFSILGLIFLDKFLKANKYTFLYLSSILIALASLTRYPGVALIATGFIALLIFQKKRILNRFYDSMLFLIISGTPLLLWLINTFLIEGKIGGRYLEIGIIRKSYDILPALYNIFFPFIIKYPLFFQILIIGISLVILLVSFRHYHIPKQIKNNIQFRESIRNLPYTLLLYPLVFFLTLFAIASLFTFTNFTFTINHQLGKWTVIPRYTVPLIPTTLILFFSFLGVSYKFLKKDNVFRILCMFLVILLFLVSSLTFYVTSYELRKLWDSTESPDPETLKEKYFPRYEDFIEDYAIYSNFPRAFYYIFKKPAYALPTVSETTYQESSTTKRLDNFISLLRNNGGVIILNDYLSNRTTNGNFIDKEQLEEYFFEQKIHEDENTTIYLIQPSR